VGGADPELGLPASVAFDRVAGADGTVHGQAEDLATGGHPFLILLHGTAEEQLEARPGRAELGGWRE
jgi:hypothetical protein